MLQQKKIMLKFVYTYKSVKWRSFTKKRVKTQNVASNFNQNVAMQHIAHQPAGL